MNDCNVTVSLEGVLLPLVGGEESGALTAGGAVLPLTSWVAVLTLGCCGDAAASRSV